MSIINRKFGEDIPDIQVTFGYITFIKRQEFSIPKTHNNDAFVVADGTVEERGKPITINQKHKNSRVLQVNRDGHKPYIRRHRYAIQPKDLIWFENKRYVAVGIQNYGRYVKVENREKVIRTDHISKKYCFGSFYYN
jgi:hypothetical protein